MSTAAHQLIESFEALPEADQREVLVELLRHTLESSYSAPSETKTESENINGKIMLPFFVYHGLTSFLDRSARGIHIRV